MFDEFVSSYWHRIEDNSYIECFEKNKVNLNTKNWQIILKLPNLEEFILDHPTREQVEAVIHLPKLRSFRWFELAGGSSIQLIKLFSY